MIKKTKTQNKGFETPLDDEQQLAAYTLPLDFWSTAVQHRLWGLVILVVVVAEAPNPLGYGLSEALRVRGTTARMKS